MATDVSSGIGFVRFWAAAPALDVVALCRSHSDQNKLAGAATDGKNTLHTNTHDGSKERAGDATEDLRQPQEQDVQENGKTLNILLLGLGDIHHILFTASRLWKETNRGYRIHFFVHEEAPEVLARHLLLLDVVNDTAMSLREKTETFIDLYANSRLLPKTVAYIHERQTLLTDFVCEEQPHPLDALVDLSHLKHRQRDEIQEVMTAWHPAVQFDVDALREQRLRHCYGQRFDYKVNLMDWNYQMNLSPMVPILHWRQYKRFALTGVTFETRLADHTDPNRTLSSYTKATDTKRGQNVKVRGFWGDIVNGPFYAYGAETRQRYRDRLFRKVGDSQRYNSHDIMTFNLSSILYSLEEMRVSLRRAKAKFGCWMQTQFRRATAREQS
ncbi:hypothetical protein TGDOM2_271315 [Toxoplasma gondii GAB2-2007-GAL-DOM2]|uniref:DUF4470 domain-containing protein n=9 Tax=Toxoplasma gondii TaxID=5811 RepID=A0A125YW41_TOXGV|nr:hypothetical protein TGGT1_271315 [Toxoplasma gondii GT1]ESS36190.1 hypothetical protein TGVEG_271315 [Toxoplasma gondii VEG]KFG43454.1 hypothetical protein TGDOM2_271315 [Toxoplasma gondii GAB2-2007-GAL-DOM2]KFG51999.1 hypothetical protein TGP89_271315 [Toxoplasma gondii p89]KFG54269.1 hypothetical protein TGFOU_271315 [Toxoplasma gondii FOU]KFH16566.1 hypothetical protein TGMAS_271315 [Toxoplasma gondii MAS]PIM01276.1 hypothetical protein TGCOUG_271315 [Toxoplasma gondii COUG]PUA92204.1